MTTYRVILVIIGTTGVTAVAGAQCPDGSPPPCRSMTVAAAPKRVNPPLDDRTWIVVPFDNTAKTNDADWLRSGSVNLLYLGLSRWTDVRVIDDERVADFMREVQEARGEGNISLNAAIAVAKRAGAGRLVMGDVLKLGSRTTVTAKVFDVKSGQRIRTAREETLVQDSVMPMFGRLAQKILNVPAPQGTSGSVVGTSSISAFQEYAEGMRALNLFDLPRARGHFERALQIDSTFALAHAKLSVLIGWETPGDPAGRAHAESAARLGANLPPRERTLVNGSVAFARQDYPRACELFSGLVRNDSTDVDAWYGYGDCLYHDPIIEAINGDTTRLRWRSDFNASLRAFQRALDVDPTYHLAYQHLVDAFAQQLRPGRYCVAENRCSGYVSVLHMIGGDSLAPSPPIALPRDTALFRRALEEYARNGSKRRSLDRALRTANRWVDANASESRARFNLGSVLLLLGNVADAEAALAPTQIAGNGQAASLLALDRFEIAIKRWRAADALRLFDSVRASPGIVVGSGARALLAGNWISLSGTILGRFAGFDSVLAGQVTLGGLTGPAARVGREIPRLLLGAPSDSLVIAERALLERVAARSATPVERIFAGLSLQYGLRLPRQSWPPIDTTARELKLRPAIAMARGDSLALRRAARSLDSLSSVYMAGLIPDTGVTIVAADAYLALGDSLAALRMTRRMLDTALASAPIATLAAGNTLVQPTIPRAMLLRADLASALGQKDEARLWYKRFLDLWAKADPEFQPLVDRVKKSYAALGGGP